MSGKRFRGRFVRAAGLMVGIGAVAATVALNRPDTGLPERPLAVSVDVEPGAGVAAAGAGRNGTVVAGELEPDGAALRGRIGLRYGRGALRPKGSRSTDSQPEVPPSTEPGLAAPGRFALEVDPSGGRASASGLRRAGVLIRVGGGAGPTALHTGKADPIVPDSGEADPIVLRPGETQMVPVSVRLERRDEAAGSPRHPDRIAIRLRPRRVGTTPAPARGRR